MRELQADGATIVLVSHALDMVRQLCQRLLTLEGGHIVAEGASDAMAQRYSELMTPTAEMAV